MAYTIITCSGISNTGKLTTRCAMNLHRICAGEIDCCIPATREREAIDEALRDAEELLIIDGCSDCCALKKIQHSGRHPDHHIIATECGIVKNGMEEPHFSEIEELTAVLLNRIRSKRG
ncbi:putative zinc-binding protein [Methanocalculus sp.]|uniref:putative zinc-binding protein n=1 Tax=Methanocalculus sp. TaxID=2004547 RepID=UPI00260F1E69|nr:putative zinc-binding protein [Methanocalculus sp.]MDG6249820.1 putative zinc-binding protein [Methanocalculus sp.]